MSLIVQKYGGSSVATLERIQAVAGASARAGAQGHSLVVVVSAMGDTTDDLLAQARACTPSPRDREVDLLLSTGEVVSCALHGAGVAGRSACRPAPSRARRRASSPTARSAAPPSPA